MAKTEYEGIAFSSVINQDGYQISVTERAESSLDAYKKLTGTLAVMEEEGCTPFVSYINKHEPYKQVAPEDIVPPAFIDDDTVAPSVVQTAKDLGAREIPAGHRYLGMKPGKMEEILENDSYDVVANTYSHDGKWVNFNYGGQQVAGYYYANATSSKIFGELFGWVPVVGENLPIPTGNLLLYILGVKAKNGTVYQNIKKVDPA